MMIKPAFLLPAVAVLLLAQAVPPPVYVVRNNTRATLECSHRGASGAWSAFASIAPGGELPIPPGSGKGRIVACKPPVRQEAFQVVPGERYSFLREGGRITLRRIATRGN